MNTWSTIPWSEVSRGRRGVTISTIGSPACLRQSNHLEAYLRRTEPGNESWPTHVYSVAVCGERLPFEKAVTLPQLKWDFKQEWNQSDFFIAPTHLNCDGDVDGKIIGTVERLGVVIAYIKDLRAPNPPETTARPVSAR